MTTEHCAWERTMDGDSGFTVEFNAIDEVIISYEPVDGDSYREVRFEAGRIHEVIAVLEELADWLEESPEEE